MSDPLPPVPRVDPWAVVEYHARHAAQRSEGSMSPTQRLALYAATAPDVIGATPVRPGELGLWRQLGREEWWKVPLPAARGSAPQWLAWSSSGQVLVERPDAMGRRMFMVATGTSFVSMFGLGRLVGWRALPFALLLAAGAAFLSRIVWPAWSRLGSAPGDERHERAVAELVERYERDVQS